MANKQMTQVAHVPPQSGDAWATACHTGRSDCVPAGSLTDKERLRNPISRRLVRRFDQTVVQCLEAIGPDSLHDVGCGEGRLTRLLARHFGLPLRATDIDAGLIARCRSTRVPGVTFIRRSIYDLQPPEDRADVVLCCEVLEHLTRPLDGLAALKRLGARRYLFSVPREPLWRVLNLCRGRYWSGLGNTPGHLNHWSTGGFLRCLAGCGFDALA